MEGFKVHTHITEDNLAGKVFKEKCEDYYVVAVKVDVNKYHLVRIDKGDSYNVAFMESDFYKEESFEFVKGILEDMVYVGDLKLLGGILL